MLCDDIIHSANPSTWNRPFGLKNPKGPLREWLEIAAERVRQCQRFVISQEALHVAVHVGNSKPSSLMAGLGIARLPFEKMFIEYDWDARFKIQTEEFGYPDLRERDRDGKVQRMRNGLLIQATDDTFRRGTMHVFSRYGLLSPVMSPIRCTFDFSAMDENVIWKRHEERGTLRTLTEVQAAASNAHPDEYSPRFAKQPDEALAMAHMNNIFDIEYDPDGQKHVRYLGEIGNDTAKYVKTFETNMGGEPKFFLSIIMLLNSRNLAAVTAVSVRESVAQTPIIHPRMNKPVVGHNKVTIRLSKVGANRMKAEGITTSGQIAYHMVRGHWKVRKTGVFFWRPHFAGNRAKGVRTHEYDVTV